MSTLMVVPFVAWCWKELVEVKGTFNVDDVGYASASDVNMNVGGKNSQTMIKVRHGVQISIS